MVKLNEEQIDFLDECILMGIPDSLGGFLLHRIVKRLLHNGNYNKGNGNEMEKINRVISWYRIKRKHNINE
jgi:hypothetical protein